MKKFTTLIAILAAFGIGWFANDTLNKEPPEQASKGENADDKKKEEGDKKDEDADKKDAEKKDDEKEEKDNSTPVAIETVSSGDISSSITFNTSVASEQSLDIHSEINGIIASIEVEEGTQVKAGDSLLVLVNDEQRIQKEESKANFDNLANEFARAENMLKEELITTQEFENKRFEYTQAKLQFERDDLLYKRSIVRAPFDGIVTERFTQTGARITPTTQLFHIINTNELIARVFIPEKLLNSISIGQPVLIKSGSLTEKTWNGSIKRISPSINIETGTFKVTIAIDSQDGSLPSGLFVSAQILTDTHIGATLLPKQAIVYENDNQYVYIVKDNKAEKRLIEPGITEGTLVEILSDITPGEQVIVQGQIGLKDKTAVKIVDPSGTEIETDEVEEDTETAQSETSEETEDNPS